VGRKRPGFNIEWGRIMEDRVRRHLMGTNALVRLVDKSPREWFDELCHRGMPHHVAIFSGHHAALLQRFARIMRFNTV